MIEKLMIAMLRCSNCGYTREWDMNDSVDKPCPACQDGSPKFWDTRKPTA